MCLGWEPEKPKQGRVSLVVHMANPKPDRPRFDSFKAPSRRASYVLLAIRAEALQGAVATKRARRVAPWQKKRVGARKQTPFCCTEVAQCCADVAENLHSSPPPASLFVSVRMSREGSCCSLVQSAYYLIYNIIDYQCYNINRVHAIQYSAHENIHETASLRMSRAGSCCSLSGAEAENNSPAAASCKICRNAKSTKLQSWQRANAAIDYLVDIPKVHIGLKIT